MKSKRLLGGWLALQLLLTGVGADVLPEISVAAKAASPWSETAQWPPRTVRDGGDPAIAKFTGKEWTGEVQSKDINGKAVRQSHVFGVNREDAHATDTLPYNSVESARKGAVDGDFSQSAYYRLLTGEGQDWALTVYKNLNDAAAAGVTDTFYSKEFEGVAQNPYTGKGVVSDYENADYGCGWRTVTLPASWQTQGFDFPIYSNIDTPWKGVYGNEGAGVADKNLVPAVPTVTNPVGFYRRTFDVDADWLANGKSVFISFQGVESAMYLYVNGYEVGYTEDSYDAHDFDITPYLNADGRGNVLAVRVHRWCDGSWIEDQDTLRLGGIFRDVYLYATPAIAIRDYKAETNLDATFTDATLTLSAEVINRSTTAADTFAMDVQLFDAAGGVVLDEPLRADVGAVGSGEKTTVTLRRLLKAPHLWSDEDPYLYTMVISLYDKESGRLFSCVSQQLGIREITFTKTAVDRNFNKTTTAYQQILLNGKPMTFRGVNRHDNDPQTGKYVSHELYETDVRLMKENNINAVRTSHYPDDRYFYYLCDKYGILVMAETNMESHSLQNDSDVMAAHFTTAFRDRLTANIQAQKNRASVVMWSLGNECGNTPGSKMLQRAIQEVVRPLDSTRPVHYEGLGGSGGVDVYSNMYPGLSTLDDRGHDADHMPYVLCEYLLSQGNSTGALQEYWDKIRQYDNLCGGFLWDFADKSIATPLPTVQVLTVDKSARACKATLKGDMEEHDEWGHVLTGGYAQLYADETLNEALSGRRSFTLELQLNPHGSGEYQTLMAKSDYQVSLRVYRDERLDLVLYDEGSWKVNTFTLPANWKDRWHHLAVTFDGTKVAMWCDGVSLSARDKAPVAKGIQRDDNTPLCVNYDASTGRGGDNEVAYARIYNRVLTAAELTAQDLADRGYGDYAVVATDAAVLLWMDFAHFTAADYHPDTGAVWDYYATVGNDEMAGHYYAYGGDWGDVINQGSYLADGVVYADRTPRGAMQEVRYVYQPIRFAATEPQRAAREVTITNDCQHIDTSRFVLRWELLEDGVVCDSGTLDTVVPAGSSRSVSVPFTIPDSPAVGSEFFLNLYAVQKEDTCYLASGTVLSHGQMPVPVDTAKALRVNAALLPAVTRSEDADTLTLTGARFTVSFDKTSGTLTSYVCDGQTLLSEGPVSNYWRPKADCDNLNNEWSSAGKNTRLTAMSCTVLAGQATVTVTKALPDAGSSQQTYCYTVYGKGAIHVESTLMPDPAASELMKCGAELTLPKESETVTYYGEGPSETYTDRRRGATVGVFETTVSAAFEPFVRPQLSGNHTGVRYMALESESAPLGLMVVGETPLEMSALHYRVSDYAGCSHPYQMPQTDYTILNVDLVSRGLGGGVLGPGVREEYKLSAQKTYRYAYTIVPYDKQTENPMTVSKPWRTAVSVPAALPQTLRGDADGDGSITTTDARLALQYSAEKIPAADLNLSAADVDQDGAVTTTDARKILQYTAEKITTFD